MLTNSFQASASTSSFFVDPSPTLPIVADATSMKVFFCDKSFSSGEANPRYGPESNGGGAETVGTAPPCSTCGVAPAARDVPARFKDGIGASRGVSGRPRARACPAPASSGCVPADDGVDSGHAGCVLADGDVDGGHAGCVPADDDVDVGGGGGPDGAGGGGSGLFGGVL